MNTTVLHSGAKSWVKAYGSFLRSRDENLILKVAPILLVIGSPEVIVSNLIPVVGEALDLGTFTLTALVAVQTFRAVRKYR